MKKPSHVFIFGIWLVLMCTSLCIAQEKVRTLDETNREHSFPNSPIAIISRELPTKSFGRDGKVLAGADWLRDTMFTVKNVSNKKIVKFQILLTIPKQGNMPYEAGMMVGFPQPERVLDAAGKPTGDYKPLAIKVLQPGSTVRVQVWQHQLKILEDLKKQGVEDVDSVLVSIRQVVFDDGTGWLTGKETQADPDNPKGQIFAKPSNREQSILSMLLMKPF